MCVCVCVGGGCVIRRISGIVFSVLVECSNTQPTQEWSYLKLEFHRENRTHRAEKPNVEVTVGLGPMPPDASDFPGGIPALR